MATLSSASSLDELLAAYADNGSYLEDGSAAKARAFITACTLLLGVLPKRVTKGGQQGEEVELDVRVLQTQIEDARRFLTQANLAAAPSRCFSLEHYRD